MHVEFSIGPPYMYESCFIGHVFVSFAQSRIGKARSMPNWWKVQMDVLI